MFRSIIWWWVSVVCVGIGINLFSAYLKPKVDTRLGKMSMWWRRRSKTQQERFDKQVAEVRNDLRVFVWLATMEFRHRMMQVITLLVGALTIAFDIWVLEMTNSFAAYYGLATITCLILASSAAYHFAGNRLQAILKEAAEKPHSKEPEGELDPAAQQSSVSKQRSPVIGGN
jgi:hypothetical protein